MLLSLLPGGALALDHWGGAGSMRGDDYLPRLPVNRPAQRHFLDGVPLAYPVHGDASFKEPCLAVVYEDGTRIARLAFQEDRATNPDGRPTLELDFTDSVHGL